MAGKWKRRQARPKRFASADRLIFLLMVTDVCMPDGDGLELMRRVRAADASTAVIVLTAFGTVAQAVQAMQNGACDYLTKPFSFEQLQSTVERVMRHSAGEAGFQIDSHRNCWSFACH